MKKFVLLVAATLLAVPAAHAGEVGFDFDLHIGNRAEAPIVVQEPPLFLAPPELGFHVAVGVPYDMFFVSGNFYLCRGDRWSVAPHYDGPWQGVGPRHLPPGLAKKRYTEIIRFRDAEYARYRKDKHHYHGKSYRPEKGHHGQGNGGGKGNGNGNGKRHGRVQERGRQHRA
jgi:hypothetical protein